MEICKEVIFREARQLFRSEISKKRHINLAEIQNIYDKIPELKKIEAKIAELGQKSVLEVLKGKAPNRVLSLVKRHVLELKEEKKLVLRQHELTPSAISIKPSCKYCNDSGIVLESHCECFKKVLKKVICQYSELDYSKLCKIHNPGVLFNDKRVLKFNAIGGSSDTSLKCSDKNISSPNELGVWRSYSKSISHSIQRFVDIKKGKNNEKFHDNLLFYGPTGVGKTYISRYIYKLFIDDGRIAIYISAPQMFDLFEGEKFNRLEDKHSKFKLKLITNAQLLIIDDLGAEFCSSHVDTFLFNIINKRIEGSLKTIINTNLQPVKIKDMYSERISSRIVGNFEIIKCIGNDLRQLV